MTALPLNTTDLEAQPLDLDYELLQLVISNEIRNNTTAAPSDEYDISVSLPGYNNSLLVLPRITAVISIFAIVCVAIEAWKDLAAGRSRGMIAAPRFRTITNIQFFYQIPLFMQALAFALGTTPAPQGLGIWGAAGSNATCTTQGLMFQFGLHGAVGWDATLSLAYLMMVRYNVPDFRLLGYLKYFHLVIWSFSVAICIYPLVGQMYNFNQSMCWIEAFPNECIGDECIRGAGAYLWQNMASFLTLLHLVYSISMMITLYCSVRGMEDETHRYATTTTRNEFPNESSMHSVVRDEASTVVSRRNSRKVAIQGMWYASGMIVTTLPATASVLLANITGLWSDDFWVFANAVVPLIGYVNFLVFMRRRTNCHTSYAKILRKAHSWLFNCGWLGHCNNQCSQSHRRTSDDVDHTGDKFAHKTLAKEHPGKSGQPTKTQDEPGMPNGKGSGMSPAKTSGGSGDGEGFVIVVKPRGASQLISDLGESQDSSEYENFEMGVTQSATLESMAEPLSSKPVGMTAEMPLTGTKNPNSKPLRSETYSLEAISEDSPELACQGERKAHVTSGVVQMPLSGAKDPASKPLRSETYSLEAISEDSTDLAEGKAHVAAGVVQMPLIGRKDPAVRPLRSETYSLEAISEDSTELACQGEGKARVDSGVVQMPSTGTKDPLSKTLRSATYSIETISEETHQEASTELSWNDEGDRLPLRTGLENSEQQQHGQQNEEGTKAAALRYPREMDVVGSAPTTGTRPANTSQSN